MKPIVLTGKIVQTARNDHINLGKELAVTVEFPIPSSTTCVIPLPISCDPKPGDKIEVRLIQSGR